LIQLIWPTYHGDGSYDDAIVFIKQQFLNSVMNPSGSLKGVYIVNSFDDATVLNTFQSIMEHIESHIPTPKGGDLWQDDIGEGFG
jgi:hypothetical protein